jgi:penicillin-binding protein 1A
MKKRRHTAKKLVSYADSHRNTAKRKSPGEKAGLSVLAAFVAVIALSIVLFLAGAFYLISLASELPRLEKEAIKPPAQTTRIYAADGSLLADLHAEENRFIVKLKDISPYMQKAIVAIEDERFFEHRGVDPIGILRSLYVDIRTGKPAQGASTITQQYVRNIYLTPEKTLERKLKEAILAYRIEQIYSKETILEKYLNTVYFGNGCYGVETASQTYFGKPSKNLTPGESALLAGIVQRPSYYNPYTNLEAAVNRRNIVLKKMLELNFITKEEYDKAIKEKVVLKPLRQRGYYFAPYFVEYVKELLIKKYGVDKVFKGGLRVYTTLQPKAQIAAEKAVSSTLDKPNDPDAALVSIEVETGKIIAMYGGKDFDKQKFNLAVQGRRQPGSSFKTFVLVTALEEGFSPYETYESSPVNIKLPSGVWKVRNAEGGGMGKITIRTATVHSVNAVFARLIMDVGPEKVVDTARRMGITSKIRPFPSIALGSEPVTVLEMASAYSTLARGGKKIEPIAIVKVTDASGRIIDEFKPKAVKAIDPWAAYTAVDILKDAVRYGTGTRARIKWPCAGKTGTAQEYRDAWFVGFTPQISTAVWVGFKNAQISMRNIHGFARVYGGTLPAIIWKKYMSVAMEGKDYVDFPRPQLEKDIIQVKICAESGLLATPFCPKTRMNFFKKGNAPKDFCEIHKGIEVPNLTGVDAEEAKKYLVSRGLTVNILSEYSDTIPKGKVIRQNPAGGTPVPEKSTVTLYVSLGPKPEAQKPPEETTPTGP